MQPASPSSAVPTSTSTPGRAELMCAQPGSAEAASATHNSHPSPSPSFASQSQATGEAHPIRSNIWVVSRALMTIPQMREQAQHGVPCRRPQQAAGSALWPDGSQVWPGLTLPEWLHACPPVLIGHDQCMLFEGPRTDDVWYPVLVGRETSNVKANTVTSMAIRAMEKQGQPSHRVRWERRSLCPLGGLGSSLTTSCLQEVPNR